MQESSQTRHYGIYRGCTAITKAIYTLTQQSWSVHLLTKLAGWFKQDPGPEVWAALFPCIRYSSTLSQLPEQPVERKSIKAATKHSYMRNIRASGVSQPTGKNKFLTLKSSQWHHLTAVLRWGCPACHPKLTSTEEGTELSISQGGLTLDSALSLTHLRAREAKAPLATSLPPTSAHTFQDIGTTGSSSALPWHKVLVSCYQCPNLSFFTEF